MSQLPDQLLKSANLPLMMPLGQPINMIPQVPMPQQIQNASNLALNQNMGLGVPVPDHKSQQNPDTSNYFS